MSYSITKTKRGTRIRLTGKDASNFFNTLMAPKPVQTAVESEEKSAHQQNMAVPANSVEQICNRDHGTEA